VEASGNDQPAFQQSMRLTFSYDATPTVALKTVEHLEMFVLGTMVPPPVADVTAGAWVELQREDGVAVFHRLVHDPFGQFAEHHAEDGTIERHEREIEPGEFEVLLPVLDEARGGEVFASPVEPENQRLPALSRGRFRFELPSETS
jgi:hypothetical protein